MISKNRPAQIHFNSLPRPSQTYEFELPANNPKESPELKVLCKYIALSQTAQESTGLPVGVVWEPLDVQNFIPVVDHAPFRCSKCSAYINPFFIISETIQCNLCKFTQNLPIGYLRDCNDELEYGTCDFLMSKYENTSKDYILCIESSLFYDVISYVRALIDYMAEGTRIGIMRFDEQLYVYDMHGSVSEIVINDPNDLFMPVSLDTLLLNVNAQTTDALDKILSINVPNENQDTLSIGNILNSIISCHFKGRLMFFTGKLGKIGPLALKNRADSKLKHNNLEPTSPLPEYVNLAMDCNNICIDIFNHSSSYIDAASLAVLCSQTGGDLYHMNREEIYYQMARIFTRNIAEQVIMRSRVSKGLNIDNYIGKFKRKGLEIEVPILDPEKSVLVMLKYDTNLVLHEDLYIQCAMAFTNKFGERLVRVYNTVIIPTNHLGYVYRGADCNAIANAYLKLAVSSIYSSNLPEIRKKITNDVVQMVFRHIQILNATPNTSKIILPEWLNLLPLYCNSILKLPAIAFYGVSVDRRILSVHQFISLPIHLSRCLLYPLVFDLLSLEDQSKTRPNLVPCSIKCLKNNRIYLIYNGKITLYVGIITDIDYLHALWNCDSIDELKHSPREIQDTGNELSQKISCWVEEFRNNCNGAYPTITYSFDSNDKCLKELMVEDPTTGETHYGDFLMKIHHLVLDKFK